MLRIAVGAAVTALFLGALIWMCPCVHAASVTFTLPRSHEGMKRIFNRYAQAWRWTRMGCATRDTCWNAEIGAGYPCRQPLNLEVWEVAGRPDGVSPYFRVLATGSAVGLAGSRLTVTLPPISGTWTFYARSMGRGGAWSCASNVLRDTFP